MVGSTCSLLLAKSCLQLALLICFLAWFGIPLIKKYYNNDIILVTSKMDGTKIRAPAVTICLATATDHGTGWKGDVHNITSFGDVLRHTCQMKTDNITACIEQETFSQTEVIPKVVKGWTKKESLMNPDFWQDDFRVTWRGRCYRLLYPQKVSKEVDTDAIFFLFNGNHSYWIDIHDPNYYIMNYNPLALKVNRIKTGANARRGLYMYYELQIHEELNIPEDPCVEDQLYSFQACVQESLSHKVGCRLKWDKWSDQERELCTTIHQYR